MSRMAMAMALAALMLISVASAQTLPVDDVATPIVKQQVRQARQVKLAQMAVLISGLSTNRSTLLLKKAVTANPTTGYVTYSIDEGKSDFLSIYAATQPVSTRFSVTMPDKSVVRQYGRILGAVETIVAIGGLDDKTKAEPDAYLLFVPIDGPLTSELPIWLISLTVADDGRVTYALAAKSIVRISPSKIGADDPAPETAASIDGTQGSVTMAWREQAYSFSFGMQILYF